MPSGVRACSSLRRASGPAYLQASVGSSLGTGAWSITAATLEDPELGAQGKALIPGMRHQVIVGHWRLPGNDPGAAVTVLTQDVEWARR